MYQQVREGKKAEAELGCDGALVAHPLLVNACKEAFDSTIGKSIPNQISKTVSFQFLYHTGIELTQIRIWGHSIQVNYFKYLNPVE